MGCNNSASQIANMSKELPKVYIQIRYCGSCGWVKSVSKVLRQITASFKGVPIDCVPEQKQTNIVQVVLIRNEVRSQIYAGPKINSQDQIKKIIDGISVGMSEKRVQENSEGRQSNE